jgi:YD repeat-containing protein
MTAVSGKHQVIGAVYVEDAGTPDAFGRSTSDTISGGAHPGASYDPAVSWFGPASVTESDGSTTKYTYTPMGQVASKIIYSGTGHAVRYNWTYDAMGDVASVTTAGVLSGTTGPTLGLAPGLPVVKNSYVYDAFGRLTAEKDDDGGSDPTANRTTQYYYDDVDLPRSVYVVYPDGSDETVSRYVDGSLVSDQGSAVTSSLGAESVIGTAGVDAHGRADANVKPGTWSGVTSNGSVNTTTTYRDTLGRVYLVQKTQPGSGAHTVQPVAEAVTSFDDVSGRVIKYVDFDNIYELRLIGPFQGIRQGKGDSCVREECAMSVEQRSPYYIGKLFNYLPEMVADAGVSRS